MTFILLIAMTSTISCILSQNTAQAFVYLQVAPLVISGTISAINLVLYGNVFFYAVSIWLFVSHYQLYPFQDYFNMIRPEILCALGQETYKFPSVLMYYVGSLTTIVIVYHILWPTRTSYMRWLWVFILFMAPAFVLVWFQFNVWYEVLFSFLWAVVMTTGFMLIIKYFLAPTWPYLECIPPCTWMGINDDAGWLCVHTRTFKKQSRRFKRRAGYHLEK